MPNQGLDSDDVAESNLATRHGMFRAVAFRTETDAAEHLALVRGEVTTQDSVLVRVHSECVTGDIFAAQRCECGEQLNAALQAIAEEGRGILVYLRGHEGRGIGLLAKVRTHVLQDEDGLDTIDSAISLGFPVDTRDYTPAVRLLRHLEVDSVRLLSNSPQKASALNAQGIRVAARVPLLIAATGHNIGYLTAKRDRLGHDLPHLNGMAAKWRP